MKRLVSLSLAVLLVVALAIPAFAAPQTYRVDGFPDFEWDKAMYPYAVIMYHRSGGYYRLLTSVQPIYFADGSYKVSINKAALISEGEEEWSYFSQSNNDSGTASNYDWVWANYDISHNGKLLVSASEAELVGEPECNGTQCSAQDIDHNNICDDCGRVLTYNLRSTLLDFANARAQFYSDTYPYYAITEHATNDKYLLVYLSKEPMIAGGTNYDTVTGTDMQWATVMENTDGTFGHTTIYPIDSWTGHLVYANHTIENFLTPPLAVVIQGVTGEALEVTLPNLMSQIKIILLCGVGCLALLVVLPLLRSRLFPFLRG